MFNPNIEKKIETTEWSDIQYKFGNKVGKYADPVVEQKILEQRIKAVADDFIENFNPNDYKDLQMIEEEMEDSYDDDRELEKLREQRLKEMMQGSSSPQFGRVRRIEKTDYVKEVTHAGQDVWCLLLLMKPGHSGCARLKEAFDTCAAKYTDIKFLEIISTECIPNFPDKQLPCVLVYRNEAMEKQVTGLVPWGGDKFTHEDVAYELHKAKIIQEDGFEEVVNHAVEQRYMNLGKY